jgi:hypothetical protein
METTYYCNDCKTSYARKYLLSQHLKSIKHKKRTENTTTLLTCECGKSYSHKNSLEYHKKTCKFEPNICTHIPVPVTVTTTPPPSNATEILLETMQQKMEMYEKEREEMKAQIAMLLEKHAGNTTNTTNNQIDNSTNNNNITININAFGNENTDYIDDKAILACIGRVYKSIPSLLEKIHFDPKHPENHNIKITNKKLPYASVMGNNKKWKTVDRKDAIDTMVNNSYNMLDDKFKENKDKIPASKQEHFRGFQSKFDAEDKELMKEIKFEVDMMVLNGI